MLMPMLLVRVAAVISPMLFLNQQPQGKLHFSCLQMTVMLLSSNCNSRAAF
jgi:hypothetical protein